MSPPSWTNQWSFISSRIKYKWLSQASKGHPESPGFINIFLHKPGTSLRLKSILQYKHRMNIFSFIPLFVIFPSGSILHLFPYLDNLPIVQYQAKAMPMIHSNTLFSLTYFLNHSDLYFIMYCLLLFRKLFLKNTRCPISIYLINLKSPMV